MIATSSDPSFRVLHALRIKGFAKASAIAELAGLAPEEVDSILDGLAADQLVGCREVRRLWQLTPKGQAIHRQALVHERLRARDADRDGVEAATAYAAFGELNLRFKQLCVDWQTRDGAVNDHLDAEHDAGIVARLVELHDDTTCVLDRLCRVIGRFAIYRERLAATCRLVAAGETNMFTGVMCGSYHDVWTELHEDLIVTQCVDRSLEGAF